MDCPSTSGQKDVSILVTEPSPECPNGPSSSSKNRLHTDSVSTLVHVLVHRESEEYQTDFEDGGKYLFFRILTIPIYILCRYSFIIEIKFSANFFYKSSLQNRKICLPIVSQYDFLTYFGPRKSHFTFFS